MAQPYSISGARASNAGDDFHVLWTARRAVKLLDPAAARRGAGGKSRRILSARSSSTSVSDPGDVTAQLA